MKPGLYEQLLTLALHERLAELADPRLCEIAPVDADDAHTVIAQFLEHILADGLATFRGAEAADRQQRLVERMVATLAEELGQDWTQQLNIATPLTRGTKSSWGSATGLWGGVPINARECSTLLKRRWTRFS